MTARPSGYGVGKSGEPAFAVRGVVEGFYGTPWTHEQRLDMVRFIGERGMNTFVYSPKDDPLLRRQWRSPYSGHERDRLAELVAASASAGVEFVFCLSPGLSIRYSSSDDVAALASKFESVAELGVGRFGLLLDDIPPALQHREDAAAWPDLVSAHIELVHAVHDRLAAAGHSLIVCPTQYYGRGTEDYIARLGRGIPDDVDLFWSGRLICSPWIDLADAETFAISTGHDPLYWDNYPVNDVAMTHELHVGPYRERDPRLAERSRGVIANGMDRAESSKIAFATVADFLWSPTDYEPEASWAAALADLLPDADDRAAYRAFAENSLSSCLNLDDAVDYSRRLERFFFLVDEGFAVDAAADLADYAQHLLDAADHLLSGTTHSTALVEEARPWIESFRVGAQATLALADLAARGRLDEHAAAVLGPYRDALLERRLRVFGDALDMALTDLVDPPVARARPLDHRTPIHPPKEAAP